METNILSVTLEKFKKEIESIFNASEPDDVILDSYEINLDCLNFIRTKKINYFIILFIMVIDEIKSGNFYSFIIEDLEKFYKSKNDNEQFKLFKSFQQYMLDYFGLNTGKYICDDLETEIDESDNESDKESDKEFDKESDKKFDKEFDAKSNTNTDLDTNANTNLDTNESEYIDQITLADAIKIKELRKNQSDALNNTIKQNFVSGVHNQCTGAGKTMIMMGNISNHYKLDPVKNKGRLYIVTCPRKEVLNKLFFELDQIDQIDKIDKIDQTDKIDKIDQINQIDNTKTNNIRYKINQQNCKFFSDNKIINWADFNIIDRVNIKKKKVTLIKTMPNILVVNSDYLKTLCVSNLIEYSKCNFITFDESHGISAEKFYGLMEMLKFQHKIHIIGYSATSVRSGSEDKVKLIFSKSTEKNPDHIPTLNLISNYDIMQAISDNIVLPPSYTIIEIKKTCKKKIGKTNKDITLNVLTNIFVKLPYKKIICWCGTIDKMKEWYKFFKLNFPNLNLYCSTSKDKVLLKQNLNTDFDKFCDAESNAILLCVNRCREGSDIANLDCGIYLDQVKKRGIVISIQTVGRILRPDKLGKKTCGFIIDSFVNDGGIEIEVITASKIINYYEKVLGLTKYSDYKDIIESYEKMKQIFTNIEYDESTSNILIRLDSDEKHITRIKLELTTKKLDWSKFKLIMGDFIKQHFDLATTEVLKKEYIELKKNIMGKNFICKEEYKDYAQTSGLEIQPEIKYKNAGWENYYSFLSIQTESYPANKEDFLSKVKSLNIKSVKEYVKKSSKYDLPLMPEELYPEIMLSTMF